MDRKKPRATRLTSRTFRTPFETAVGGNAVSQVLQGEQRYDLVMRYQAPYRDTQGGHRKYSACSRPPASASLWLNCATMEVRDGASEIYREENSRYVAIKYSVRGRDLGSAVEEAISKVNAQVKLPTGYTSIGPANTRARNARSGADARAADHHSGDFHDSLHHVRFREVGAADSRQRRHGARWRTCWPCFSPARTSAFRRALDFWRCSAFPCRPASSCSNTSTNLRARGHTIADAAIEGAVLRLRPIMMTMLVATLGLLPAALSRGIGSDSQRPFAIVIVGGLVAALVLSIFLLPTLYVWVASEGDKLPDLETDFDESA